MEYTIQAVCRELGLTVHTVRYYCDKGLVPGLRRDKHGNRLFDERSVNWLRAAMLLRSSGLSIAEIRHYFALCQKGMESIEERYQILSALQHKTEEEAKAVQFRLDCISKKVLHCQEIMAGLCEDDCNPLNW